jgi:predicted RNA-binding Zn-ribbon protein involved in translation (DUF1610 family)
MTTDAQAQAHASAYRCPSCGARAVIAADHVTVDHSLGCPRLLRILARSAK